MGFWGCLDEFLWFSIVFNAFRIVFAWTWVVFDGFWWFSVAFMWFLVVFGGFWWCLSGCRQVFFGGF